MDINDTKWKMIILNQNNSYTVGEKNIISNVKEDKNCKMEREKRFDWVKLISKQRSQELVDYIDYINKMTEIIRYERQKGTIIVKHYA